MPLHSQNRRYSAKRHKGIVLAAMAIATLFALFVFLRMGGSETVLDVQSSLNEPSLDKFDSIANREDNAIQKSAQMQLQDMDPDGGKLEHAEDERDAPPEEPIKSQKLAETEAPEFPKKTDDNTQSLASKLQVLQKEMEQLQEQLKLQSKISEGIGKTFPPVKVRNERQRKRILVTGGCGFVGSHLVDSLMKDGHEVIALDNYFTGRKRNVEQWIGHPNFEVVHHDVVNPYFVEVDQIYHLASPASPPHYMYNPVKTIKTNTIGTINMLGLAKRVKATVLLASTSEIYGDPEVHPQPETYWGHVNTIGPRSCYDEGKRVAESLMVAYNKQENITIRIARIFNTFGPRMHMDDGRVVSNFIIQALQKQPISVYGNGTQTRSFQYVTDLVDGLIALMNSNTSLPVNLGNPEEHTINDFAHIIRDLVGSKSDVVHKAAQEDDPQQRKPDISRAASLLGWKPKVTMHDGLKRTIEYFRNELREEEEKAGTTAILSRL